MTTCTTAQSAHTKHSIPQASSIFRLLHIVSLFKHAHDCVGQEQVQDLFEHPRDRQYYVAAATETLGLVEQNKKELTLTDFGQQVYAAIGDVSRQCSLLRDKLLSNPYYKAVADGWSLDVISSTAAKDEKLSGATAARRLSSFVCWHKDIELAIKKDEKSLLKRRQAAMTKSAVDDLAHAWDAAKDVLITCCTQMQNYRNSFKRTMMQVYGSRCALTANVCAPALAATHIVPVGQCTYEQAMDINNGLLLDARFGILFEQGLISFKSDGTMLVSKQLRQHKEDLGIVDGMRLAVVPGASKKYLAYHRKNIFTV